MQVDGAGRAVIINIGVKIKPGVEKSRERAVAGFVNGKALWREKGIMNQPLAVDGAGVNATHVRIARDVVEVIESKNTTGQRLKKAHPLGFAMIFFAILFDRKSDVFRAQLLASGERHRSDCGVIGDDVAQMLLNNRLTEIFVREIVVG